MQVVSRAILIFCALFLVVTRYVSGQDITYFNTSNGLPSNTVYHIVQSNDYFLWMATDKGIIRYDGSVFTSFDKSNGLHANENFEIKTKKNGNKLFLGANGQISHYTNSWLTKSISSTDDLTFTSFVSEYIEMSDGSIAAAGFGDGIKIIKNGLLSEYTTSNGLLSNFVSFIWERGGHLHFISSDGIGKIVNDKADVLVKFDEPVHFSRALVLPNGDVLMTAKGKMANYSMSGEFIELGNGSVLTDLTINKIQSVDGQMIASSYSGLHFFKIKNNEIVIERSLLEQNQVTSVLKDHEGNYWASTLMSGVVKISNMNLHLLTESREVNCILQQENAQLLFGVQGLTIGHYNEISGISYVNLGSKNKYSQQDLNGIVSFGGRIWYETDGGIASLVNNQISYYRTSSAHIIFYSDALYVGNRQGVYRLKSLVAFDSLREVPGNDLLLRDIGEHLLNVRVNCFKESSIGLLIGTDNGLYLLNNNGELKKQYTENIKCRIVDIDTKDEEIALASAENGLFHIKNGKVTHFDIKSGLSSNYCSTVELFDDYFIAGTSRGVNILRKSEFSSIWRVTKLFQSKLINDFSVIGDKIYIATSTGLYGVNKFTYGNPKFQIPLQVNRVFVEDKTMTNAHLNLSYNQNNLRFDLNYFSFSNEKADRFYRLNDDSWRLFEGQLQFSKMAPGEYSVEMKVVCNGNESDIVKRSFTINVPWWSTWWFRISTLFAFVLLIYWFFKVRILTYNRDIVREIMTILLNYLKKEKFILVKNVKDGSKSKVILNELIYLESSRNYVTLFLKEDKLMIRASLKSIGETINEQDDSFMRCHRSFIVNTKKISAFHGEFLKLGDSKVPIGINYVQLTKERLTSLKMID